MSKTRIAILILAAGKSTRVAKVISGRQKCGEKIYVPFIGTEKPAIQYQIEFARHIIDTIEKPVEADIYVVVGYRSQDVIRWLKPYSDRITVIFDTEIQGIANVWRRFTEKTCTKLWFGSECICDYDIVISINGDDIHNIDVAWELGKHIEMFIDRGGKMTIDGIVAVAEHPYAKNKSVYLVNEKNLVTRIWEKAEMMSDKLYIGTGIYVIKMDWLPQVKYKKNKETGEIEPGDILNQMIKKGAKIYLYIHKIDKWLDIGNPNIMEKLRKEG